uniref:Uncharacterized protein n=1 Tax=Anguilla anguilla TaxID=7936 RepID=A0A0E9XA62_ANGAN
MRNHHYTVSMKLLTLLLIFFGTSSERINHQSSSLAIIMSVEMVIKKDSQQITRSQTRPLT